MPTKSTCLDSILSRKQISAKEFAEMMNSASDIAIRVAETYRRTLSKMFSIPADKIYPDDQFDLYFNSLPDSEWDIAGIYLDIETECNVEFSYELTTRMTLHHNTVGAFFAQLLSSCSGSKR